MYVDVAPTAKDMEFGIPLSDNGAGKLLCDMMAAAGIRRIYREKYIVGKGDAIEIDSEVYVTTLSKEYIDPVDFGPTYFSDKKFRIPKPELQPLLDQLSEEINIVNPNIIIAAGEFPLRVLTSRANYTHWQGSVIASTLANSGQLPGGSGAIPTSRKVIPIVSPATTLKEWKYRPLSIRFLKRAKEQSAFAELRRRERTKIIAPTFVEVEQCFLDYKKAPALSFDIETKANHISCIGFAKSPEHGICIPFISSGGHYWQTTEEETAIWKMVAELLASLIPKYAQNGPFDCSHLLLHGVPVNELLIDTMLLQSVLYPELEKSLATLTMLYTDIPYYKDKGRAVLGKKNEKVWKGAQADLDLWDYNVIDCLATYEAAEKQMLDLHEFSSRQVRW